jgi:hypothetical protein
VVLFFKGDPFDVMDSAAFHERVDDFHQDGFALADNGAVHIELPENIPVRRGDEGAAQNDSGQWRVRPDDIQIEGQMKLFKAQETDADEIRFEGREHVDQRLFPLFLDPQIDESNLYTIAHPLFQIGGQIENAHGHVDDLVRRMGIWLDKQNFHCGASPRFLWIGMYIGKTDGFVNCEEKGLILNFPPGNDFTPHAC